MKCIDIHHIGIWVDDMDEMIAFLTETLGLQLAVREPRGAVGSGERALFSAGGAQLIEILTEPNVQPRPDVPVHPLGHVAGIPHICLRVIDLPAWEEQLNAAGYPITKRWPDEGYADTLMGPLRVLWFTGPSGVGFELFEFKEEKLLSKK
jgi:catechol 2,3-dioxygenase-like lactoylglutathione lyase family enzyme